MLKISEKIPLRRKTSINLVAVKWRLKEHFILYPGYFYLFIKTSKSTHCALIVCCIKCNWIARKICLRGWGYDGLVQERHWFKINFTIFQLANNYTIFWSYKYIYYIICCYSDHHFLKYSSHCIFILSQLSFAFTPFSCFMNSIHNY